MQDEFKLCFHDILDKKKKKKNLSKVAREIGISKNLLHDWAKAKRKPSLKNIGKVFLLAQYLELSLEEILFGNKTHFKNEKENE